MSDSELAWAAAQLEAEGHFRKERKNATISGPLLTYTNTDYALVDRLHRAFGGLGSVSQKTPEPGCQPARHWKAVNRHAEAIIEMILPYMTKDGKKYPVALGIKSLMNGRPRTGRTKIGPELGRPGRFRTLTDLRHDLVQSMLFGTLENRGIDYIASIDCIRYADVYRADSMEFDFDMGRGLWLNRQRWTRLVREYLDPSETRQFIDRAGAVGTGEGKRGVITSMPTASVQRQARKHRWGGCVLGWTFRGLRTGTPTLSMHSRVSYVAYIGALDLALCYVLAKQIGKRIEAPVEDFAFEWHLGSAQLHAFKSLPMLYSDGWMHYFEDEGMRERYPAIKLISRWHDGIVDSTERDEPLEQIKYGPLRRVTRRYREFVNEDWLPTVMVDELDLSPLYR
jgi:hypothetical protein